MLRSKVKVWGIHVISPRRKEGCGGKDLQKSDFKPEMKEWG